MYTGVYSGLSYLVFNTDSAGIGSLNSLLTSIANAGKSSMVVSIFMMPAAFISDDSYFTNFYNITPTSRTATFEGYVPKNNKLFCYPYNFLYVSNNQGGGAVYRYEFMDNMDNPEFLLTGDMSPSPAVYLMPKNYKGLTTNTEEQLIISNFPQCSWNNDAYANWLAQNANSMLLSAGTNIAMGAMGAYSGNMAMAATGAMGVANQLAQIMDRSIQPSQAMGNIGGSSAVAVALKDFFFYPTTITKEYAQRIDKYFDMYGYKVNTVKKPNLSGRPYWNYVQTIDVNIKGEVPMNDLQKLKSIYNTGVTIWHSGDNIGNYSLNNH
jgi:hypothetical protein